MNRMQMAAAAASLGLALNVAGGDEAEARFSAPMPATSTATTNMINLQTQMMLMTTLIIAMDDAQAGISVADALRGPMSHFRACAFDEGLDAEQMMKNAHDSDVNEATDLDNEDLGISPSEAKALSACVKKARETAAQHGAFALGMSKPTLEQQYNTIKGDHDFSFQFEDYEYCHGQLAGLFNNGVSQEDVHAFLNCTDEFLNADETAARRNGQFLLAGGAGIFLLGAVALGYALRNEL